jgi:hypothetical protein
MNDFSINKTINRNFRAFYYITAMNKQMIWKVVYHKSHSFVECCRLADGPRAFRQTFR